MAGDRYIAAIGIDDIATIGIVDNIATIGIVNNISAIGIIAARGAAIAGILTSIRLGRAGPLV